MMIAPPSRTTGVGAKRRIGRGARSLIEVHVLRLADAGDDDVVLLRDRARVERRGLRHEIGQDEVRIACRDRDDALAVIRHDVQAEAQARAARDLADRLVERIAVELREPDAGVLEEPHTVRRGDHGLAAASDRDGLPPAGVAGVLVRLDDARGDDEVGVLDDLLGQARDPIGRDRPEVSPVGRISALGVDDPHAIHDRSQFLPLLRVGRRPMETDGDDDGDPFVRDAAAVQFVEHRRDEHVVGRGAGEVRYSDDGRGGARSRVRDRLAGQLV